MPKDNKTIAVTVYFFTDDNPDDPAQTSSEARAQGTVYVPAQPRHGIKAGREKHFNRMADLPAALEDVLTAAGVTLRLTGRATRLYPARD